MNIALRMDHDLHPGELSGKRRLSRSLTMVPLPVDLRHGVNTVRDRIGVRNLQGLVRPNTKNARPEPASILINCNRRCGRRKGCSLQLGFHIYEGVSQPAFGPHNQRLIQRVSVVRFHARGISAHVNFLRQGPFADIANHSRDRSGRERIILYAGSGSLLHLLRQRSFPGSWEKALAIAIRAGGRNKTGQHGS